MPDNNFQRPRNMADATTPATAVPHKRKRWPWIGLGIVAVLFVIGALTSALGGSKPEPAATTTAISDAPRLVPAVPVTPAPKPAPRDPLSSDGTYRVGSQVLAGAYSYTVTSAFGGYWATCADLECAPGSGMTGNDYAPTLGQTGFIEIAPSDAYVELSGLELVPA